MMMSDQSKGPSLVAGNKRLQQIKRLVLITTMAFLPAPGSADQCERVIALETYSANVIEPDGSTCEMYLGLANSTGVSCHWSFPFRSIEAGSIFEELWAEITNCRAGTAHTDFDPVNHPDSYHLRELVTENGLYRLVTKDKNRARRSLVFFSYEHRQ